MGVGWTVLDKVEPDGASVGAALSSGVKEVAINSPNSMSRFNMEDSVSSEIKATILSSV